MENPKSRTQRDGEKRKLTAPSRLIIPFLPQRPHLAPHLFRPLPIPPSSSSSTASADPLPFIPPLVPPERLPRLHASHGIHIHTQRRERVIPAVDLGEVGAWRRRGEDEGVCAAQRCGEGQVGGCEGSVRGVGEGGRLERGGEGKGEQRCEGGGEEGEEDEERRRGGGAGGGESHGREWIEGSKDINSD